jgi:hypothetical protein
MSRPPLVLCGCPALGAFLVVTAGAAGPAFAQQLPFKGAFGAVAGNGCQSYKEETEGDYIVTNENGRGYGAMGECGCNLIHVQKTGPSTYRLRTVCQCIDGPKRTEQATVVVTSPHEIKLDGRRFVRCR